MSVDIAQLGYLLTTAVLAAGVAWLLAAGNVPAGLLPRAHSRLASPRAQEVFRTVLLWMLAMIPSLGILLPSWVRGSIEALEAATAAVELCVVLVLFVRDRRTRARLLSETNVVEGHRAIEHHLRAGSFEVNATGNDMMNGTVAPFSTIEARPRQASPVLRILVHSHARKPAVDIALQIDLPYLRKVAFLDLLQRRLGRATAKPQGDWFFIRVSGFDETVEVLRVVRHVCADFTEGHTSAAAS